MSFRTTQDRYHYPTIAWTSSSLTPPYSDNIRYSDHPACIGKISCEKEVFFDELEKVAKEIHRILKPERVMAWLIGDHWRSESGFIPVGFKLFGRLLSCFKPLDLVCVTRRHQSSNTLLWRERAREHNFYLRGFKYLFIMRRTENQKILLRDGRNGGRSRCFEE